MARCTSIKMSTPNLEKCVSLAKTLISTHYELLEQLGDPQLTEEVSKGLRLLLENKIPCTMGLRMSEVYREDRANAQAVREALYAIGEELCKPNSPFYKLRDNQREQLSSRHQK